MTKRTYSPDEKGAALAALDANGGNVKRTAAMVDVPRKTLEGWDNGSGVTSEVEASREQKTLELANSFEDLARKIVAAAPDKIEKAGLKDSVFSAAIAIDKSRLLRGQATSINEVQMRDALEGVVARCIDRARDAGEPVTREIVVARLIQRRPEVRAYLEPRPPAESL